MTYGHKFWEYLWLKTVIDQSMTLFEGLQKVGLWTFINCHWLVNDSLESVSKRFDCGLLETVIDWSMTVWVTNIARTYGHVSLTPVNDTKFMDICHWLQSMTEIYGQTCQKVSLTAVNDKKKCHWLDVYYIWVKVMLVCQKNDAFVNGSHNWQSSLIGQITTQLLLCTAFGGTHFIFSINIRPYKVHESNNTFQPHGCLKYILKELVS